MCFIRCKTFVHFSASFALCYIVKKKLIFLLFLNRNSEYKLHVKCITESEKYESKGSFVSKANKGDLKQNTWLEKVSAALATFRGSQRARFLLEKLTDFPNVPRKKPKFFNFMLNSFRSHGVTESQLEEIWSVIEAFDKKQQQVAPPPQPRAQSDEMSTVKKRKLDQVDADCDSPAVKSDENTSFDWTLFIKNECCKHPNNEVDLSKLEKKVRNDSHHFKSFKV